MGTEGPAAKKATMTAKAIIHQRFGDKACYRVEEVHEAAQNGCPGLAIPRKGPCLYRCRLELPDISVVSETFKKKKDSEQAAAQKALLEVAPFLSLLHVSYVLCTAPNQCRVYYVKESIYFASTQKISIH